MKVNKNSGSDFEEIEGSGIVSDWLERDERLRLALGATGLGTWEMDLVNNRRHWSDETFAMHGLQRDDTTDQHLGLTDKIMHPEDQIRLKLLHDELRAGLNDYFFEYRTTLPDNRQRWISARGKVLARQAEGPTRIVGVCADITSRKNAELAQRHSDLQFRKLSDALPQLVWMANEEGHVTYFNSRRSAYFPDADNMSSQALWQPLVHSEDISKTVETWAGTLKSQSDYEMEHRLRMADGSYRWHLSRATPVHTQTGEISAWFGTATDIERLKQAEINIQSGIERLQIATEAASMFAWEIDFKSAKVKWADNAAEIIKCSPQDLNDDPKNGSFFVHPDDRERILVEFDRFWQSGSDRFEMEFKGLPHLGVPMYWRTAGKFIRNEKGEPERAIGVTQDISRHVETGAHVQLLNDRLSTAEEGAGAMVYEWNLLENYVWRSHGVTRILGWEPSELASVPSAWYDLVHPDDLTYVGTENHQKHLDSNDRFMREYRVRHKDGRYRWVNDTGRVFRNEAGEVIHQDGTTTDITARKQAELVQQRMSNLIELSFEPILVWQPSSGIIEWNRGAEILYGYTRQEALGHMPHELLRTRDAVPFSELMQQFRLSPIWTGELENTARDGTKVIVESRYQLMEYEGTSVILETNRDLRETKQADIQKARMAAVVAASQDALYGFNLNGEIEAWNSGAEKLFGYSESEVLGKHISILAHPEQHLEQVNVLHEIAAGKSVAPFETLRLTRDGRRISVSKSMSAVKAPDGKVVAISVASHDISDRKEWEVRQRMMNRELAHRVKNSFAILQAILRATLRTTPDPEQFAATFSRRLLSLATAHDVLTANDWRGAELGALLRQHLSSYVTGHRIRLSGEAINLPAERATPLSLIINELAANALKYGALSVPSGRIDVSWQTGHSDGNEILNLKWLETGGPAIKKVGPRGYGTTLIKKSLADAEVHLDFRPEGLSCVITIPTTEARVEIAARSE